MFLLFIDSFENIKKGTGSRPSKSVRKASCKEGGFHTWYISDFQSHFFFPEPSLMPSLLRGNFTRELDLKDLVKYNSEHKFAGEEFCWEKPKRNMFFTLKEQPKKIYRMKGNIKTWRKWKKKRKEKNIHRQEKSEIWQKRGKGLASNYNA